MTQSPTAGELLILMYGIGGNKLNWITNIEVFGQYFKTVAWDARGYGESDDYSGELKFSDFADDLSRVMDYYNVEKAHLLGLSMGGRIAFSFCEKYSHRIASLILCDTHKGFQHFSKEQQEDFIRLRKEPLLSGKEPKDIAPVVAKTLIGTISLLINCASRIGFTFFPAVGAKGRSYSLCSV